MIFHGLDPAEWSAYNDSIPYTELAPLHQHVSYDASALVQACIQYGGLERKEERVEEEVVVEEVVVEEVVVKGIMYWESDERRKWWREVMMEEGVLMEKGMKEEIKY